MKRSFKKPNRPQTTEMLVDQYLAAARDAAMQWRAVPFDASPATIEVLEGMLEELYQQMKEKSSKRMFGRSRGVNENDVSQWANLWGIYLGETLRVQLGGKWITGHEEAPSLLAVEFPDGTVAFPTARVFRRLIDGAGENIVEYYQAVVQEVGTPAGEEGETPASDGNEAVERNPTGVE